MARNRVGTRTTMTHHLLHVRRNRLNYGDSYVRASNSSKEEISRKQNLIWCQTIFLPNARSDQQKKLRAKKISVMPYISVRPLNCSAEEMSCNEILDRIHMLCQDLQPLFALRSPEILCSLPYKPLNERSSILARWYKISSFDWIDLFLVVVETNVKLFAMISSFDLIDVFFSGLL